MRWVALLLVGCAAPEPAPTAVPDVPAAQETATGVLDDPAYRFCHVPGADAGEAREFCDLLEGQPPDVCPGLRETCEEGAEESVLDASGCVGGGAPPGSTPAAPPEPPSEPFKLDLEPWSCKPPVGVAGWLTAVAQWTAAIVVALVVLVVIRLVVRALGWRRPDRAETEPTERAIAREVPPPDEIPDAPGEDLLAAAQAALEAGRWGDAVLLARAASLRRLADAGRIRLHRSRTDREYLRSVRREEPVHEALGDVLREVEAERWGARQAGESAARRVLDAARRILGLIAAAGFLVVLVAASTNWRYGPMGDAALYALFADRGYAVSWRLRGLSALEDDTDLDVLVVDLSGIRPSDRDWEAIRGWVSDGGLLIVAGDAEIGFPHLGAATDLPEDTPVHVPDWLANMLPAPRFANGPAIGWQDGKGDAWVSTGTDGSAANAALKAGEAPVAVPAAVVVQSLFVDAGTVLAIADARLLWNGSLVAPENRAFLGDLVSTGRATDLWLLDDPVRVQLATSASAGSENPIGALANARLLPAVLQLLALVVLGALWKGWPFGLLRDPPDDGRLQFADHVRAVGAGYSRRRASRHALATTASLWLARLGGAGLEQRARQAGRTAEEARRFVEEARAAAESGDAPARRSDLEAMEELWRITRRS